MQAHQVLDTEVYPVLQVVGMANLAQSEGVVSYIETTEKVKQSVQPHCIPVRHLSSSLYNGTGKALHHTRTHTHTHTHTHRINLLIYR